MKPKTHAVQTASSALTLWLLGDNKVSLTLEKRSYVLNYIYACKLGTLSLLSGDLWVQGHSKI